MKVTLQKSRRYKGYQLSIDPLDETFLISNQEGKPVVRMVMDDFMDRLGAGAPGFKRKYPRLGLGVHVTYRDPGGENQEGIASTIGGGGLFIEQFLPLAEGSETILEFSLPASRNRIKAKAKVAWVRPKVIERICFPGMGLQFTDISDQDRAELLHFVETFNRQRGIEDF